MATQTKLGDLRDAAQVRSAAARLERDRKAKRVTAAEYRRAHGIIARAAVRFGVKLAPAPTPPATRSAPAAAKPSGVHVTVRTRPNGHRRVDVMHAADGDRVVFGDKPVRIDATPLAEVLAKLADVEKRLKALPANDATDAGAQATRATLEADVAKLRDEVAAPRWNQIARVGAFLGHPSGHFELTPGSFDQIISNYKLVDGGEVPIDFEHASEADESSGSIPTDGAPAQGYVLDLQNRGKDGLWGLCRFLEPAFTYVREGKYKFFSPAIRFGAKHPETGRPIGARLTSVALVTRPFLRDMHPLAARDPSAPGATITMSLPTTHHEMMKSLKACMKLPDMATHADMKDGIGKLREHGKAILDQPAVSASGHYSASGVHLGDYLPPLAEAINAPAHMACGEILDAVEEMIDAAIDRHEAEMHTPMSDATNTTPTSDDPGALNLALGETKEKLRAKDAEARTLMSDKSALELRLRDAQSNVETLTAAKALLEGELKTLRDGETKRVEQVITADVELAFATYKDTKKLSDKDRDAMVIVRKTNPDLFASLYPAVAPNQRHLLRDLTGGRAPGAGGAPAPGPGGTTPLTPAEQVRLADKLVSEKKMSREAATSLSFQVATGQRPMPQFG